MLPGEDAMGTPRPGIQSGHLEKTSDFNVQQKFESH